MSTQSTPLRGLNKCQLSLGTLVTSQSPGNSGQNGWILLPAELFCRSPGRGLEGGERCALLHLVPGQKGKEVASRRWLPHAMGRSPPPPPQSRSLIMPPPKTGTLFSHLGPQSKHTLCLLLRCSPVRSLEQIRHLPEMGGESSLWSSPWCRCPRDQSEVDWPEAVFWVLFCFFFWTLKPKLQWYRLSVLKRRLNIWQNYQDGLLPWPVFLDSCC